MFDPGTSSCCTCKSLRSRRSPQDTKPSSPGTPAWVWSKCGTQGSNRAPSKRRPSLQQNQWDFASIPQTSCTMQNPAICCNHIVMGINRSKLRSGSFPLISVWSAFCSHGCRRNDAQNYSHKDTALGGARIQNRCGRGAPPMFSLTYHRISRKYAVAGALRFVVIRPLRCNKHTLLWSYPTGSKWYEVG